VLGFAWDTGKYPEYDPIHALAPDRVERFMASLFGSNEITPASVANGESRRDESTE
jgi:hypothetical protein